MEIREGNIIINVDQKLDSGEQRLVKECGIILRTILERPKRNDFKIMTAGAFGTVMEYLLTMLKFEKEEK